MKAFTNTNARDVRHAVALLKQARDQGRTAAIAGGGSDLLGMMKERLVMPDMVVRLIRSSAPSMRCWPRPPRV